MVGVSVLQTSKIANMSLGCDLSVLEELTSNAKQIQDDVLTKILKANANTEYLSRFLEGSSDKELFKKNVPVVSYEDVKPYIDRVANGEPSDIISGEPITTFNRSSGTSSGNQKIYPTNNIYFENLLFGYALSSVVMSKHVDGYKQGKMMIFRFTHKISPTPCGLPIAPALTSFTKSKYYSTMAKNNTSPYEVALCPDPKQSMYCQLLCGLVQRDEVVSVGTTFPSVLVQIVHFLENYWKELSSNIRSGHVSDWITDLSCRDSVSIILGEPNAELADLIEKECGQESWQGIIKRLWPKTKCIETIVTGTMSQHIPALDYYSNKLPLVSKVYASSEVFYGLNLNPLSKPQHVSYTFLPNMSYFEFIRVDADGEDTSEIVDLVDVTLGYYYEPLVTNYSGLHRCRVGDVLQVTGFYNNTPQFRFVRRNNTVLCVDVEPTTEEDILKALARATVVLESSDFILTGFTCYGDISTVPGHYVFYLEVKAKVNNGTNVLQLDNKVLVECCCIMEESLSSLYRRLRGDEGSIGALEIRVVQQGTFDSLMEFFLSRGSSISQYKTPICIKSTEALKLLEDKVLARFFSDRSPTL
ncbi:4-substituted benzoates-glutamate ligase GH3.12-like [Brassica rapa]|uniref:4-substituted benzoates-glutamate ligase GH3.12-like n=1 Tax=Brassica campestris TaxID=3711 RepID=UPI00142E17C4|nr:4-substituted benzoates-glutamate ligase GH3.12-like [Brassica rapa]